MVIGGEFVLDRAQTENGENVHDEAQVAVHDGALHLDEDLLHLEAQLVVPNDGTQSPFIRLFILLKLQLQEHIIHVDLLFLFFDNLIFYFLLFFVFFIIFLLIV